MRHRLSAQKANGKKEKIRLGFQEINFKNKTLSGQTRRTEGLQTAKKEKKKIRLDTLIGDKKRKRRETGASEEIHQSLA